MIRAIIVDDEEWVRLGLREQADWQSLGVEIAAEASNVTQAVELVETFLPEIVITDMRMPHKSGVDLLGYLYHQHPGITVIVISGYSEFEYAQKAVTYHAFDYLLKPIEDDRLTQVLQNAVRKILADKKHSEMLNLQSKYVQNDRHNSDKMLTDLLYDIYVDISELSVYTKINKILFSQNSKVIIVFEAFNFLDIVEREFKKDANLASFALQNMLEELLSQLGNILLFRNYNRLNQLIAVAYEADILTERTKSILKDTVETIKQFSRLQLLVLISDSFVDIESAGGKYHAAVEVLKDIGMKTDDGIAFAADLNRSASSFVISDEKRRSFQIYIQNGAPQHAHAILDGIFQSIATGLWDAQSIREALLGLIIPVSEDLRKSGVDIEMLLGGYVDELMNGYFTVHSLHGWIEGITDKMIQCFSNNRQSNGQKIVEEAIHLIDSKYPEKITLAQISKKHFINVDYLARIFKLSTGDTFGNYLNKRRMQAAVALIAEGRMKIRDISKITGFDNEKNFFRKFKEHFHCTPSEYQKNITNLKAPSIPNPVSCLLLSTSSTIVNNDANQSIDGRPALKAGYSEQ